MSKIIIGIDPDSKAHGVAVYMNGKLEILTCMSMMDIYNYIDLDVITAALDNHYDVEFHIEDVCGMNAVFRQRQTGRKAIDMKMANSVGRCQQAQIELERMAEYFDIKVVKHKISKTWKKDKAQFENVTGWRGRSNEDTRSAAYFGWLGCK